MSEQPHSQAPLPSDAPTDGELVAAVVAGERERFRELVERHQAPIHRYLYRMLLGDAHLAEDLTQTVFLRAYRGLRQADPARPLRPWLYRIAHNVAANHLRYQARHPTRHLTPEAWAVVPDADAAHDDPEQALAAAQEHQRLHAALRTLKPAQRSALTLHYFEDLPYRDIAAALAVPVGTVGTLLHRARKALRKRLDTG